MTVPSILLAEDDPGVRTVLGKALEHVGYTVRSTADSSTLWGWIEEGDGDLVITDVMLPDGDGLDLLPRIRAVRPDLKIIVISARKTILTSLKAEEEGAFEYLPKPFDLQDLVSAAARALMPRDSVSTNNTVDQDDEDSLPLIGQSAAMQAVYRTLARLTDNDLSVMIFGESGTGKELVARVLHEYGRRRNGPFVALNMAAIPRDLIESELFGHQRGAFTGAVTPRVTGRFSQANGGTLFLDEIGDMPADAQSRLLRVLQEGEYTPVGGPMPICVDVRIVAATRRDLAQMVQEGTFREDLYYRLNVVPMQLPSLRDRLEDIPDLVGCFLGRAIKHGLPGKAYSAEALNRLQSYGWPGNVRELENFVLRLSALYPDDIITADIVNCALSGCESPGSRVSRTDSAASPPVLGDSLAEVVERSLTSYFEMHGNELPPSGLYERLLREFERPLLSLVLGATHGNQIRAAHLLGLNRNTVRKKIRELGIVPIRGSL